ncbi:hypothetical protein [Nocardia jinanensis]|uniref:Branched-chain amino acid ABC transporter permease n=1 Tax=Nocardia jinanensis TaxID=382504 RepID=A0A917RPW9_9NOCA|nr:hypothetical protein [Nocardia jinanensis]GGL17712.1 hypothetical protein GCM10011588_35560 [Nocardia jinanensis]
MLVLNSAAGWIWGVQSREFPAMVAGPVLMLGPVVMSRQSVVIVGAIVGGLCVGVAENLAGTYISWIGHDFEQAVALVLILGVLLLKPEGLLGAKKVARV